MMVQAIGLMAIGTQHKPMPAPTTSILHIQAAIGNNDIPEDFPPKSTSGAYRPHIAEPAAAFGALMDIMDLRPGSNGIRDGVPVPAERAGGRCAILPHVVRRVSCPRCPI